jgi:hypothetical protein
MNGMEAGKTAIHHKKEVGIRTSQMGVCIECNAIYGHEDRFGKVGVMEEFYKEETEGDRTLTRNAQKPWATSWNALELLPIQLSQVDDCAFNESRQ